MTGNNVVALAVGVLVLYAIGCSNSAPAGAAGGKQMTIEIRSTAFAAGERIPRKYTGEGENISPPLSWSGVPDGAQELVLIVDDPDAPRPQPWVHWLLYKMPPQTSSLLEGVPTKEKLDQPPGAVQGMNSGSRVGYAGPMPPPGHGVHHYHFKLYAIDKKIDLGPGVEKDALLKAMQGHILAQGELVGTYERK